MEGLYDMEDTLRRVGEVDKEELSDEQLEI